MNAAATTIGRIAGAKLTDDGQHLLVQTFQPDGQGVVFALRRDQLMPLVDLAALGFTESNKVRPGIPRKCGGLPANE